MPDLGAMELAVLTFFASQAFSVLATEMSDKPITPKKDQGLLVNATSSEDPIARSYGNMRVGINRAYMNSTGDNREWFHVVGVLGKGPCGDFVNLFLNGKPYTDFGSDVEVYYHNGSASQTYDTVLASYDSRWADAMRDTAYVYVKMYHNTDKFASFPDITVEHKGRLLYDVRTESTAWSNNGALVAWDLATKAMKIPEQYLDQDSFVAAANWCDSNGYTFNGSIREREAAIDLFDKVLRNFRAKRIWSRDKLKIKVLDYDATVMEITDDDVVSGSEKASSSHANETYNSARVTFVNAAKGYVREPISVPDGEAIKADGKVKDIEFELNGTVDYSQLVKIAAYEVDRSRLGNIYNITCRPKARPLESIDMVNATLKAFGWTNQVARVIGYTPRPDKLVDLALWKEIPELYDDSINVTDHEIFTTTLPDPLAVPPSVVNIQWEEETYIQGDNTYSRIKINFDPPPNYPFFRYAEAYISWDGGTTYKSLGKNSVGFTVETLREGQSFLLKLISVSLNYVKQSLDYVSPANVSVNGLSNPPANVGGFQLICNRQDINCVWTGLDPADLRFYELRYGVSWNMSFFITSTKSVSFPIAGIRPGSHTLLLKALNTAGRYSDLPATASVTTFAPIGYTQSSGSPYNEDYDSGTHYNTEYIDDGQYGRSLQVKANALTDGGLEIWASATDLTSWTEVIAGTSTVNREASIVHGGTYSCRLDIDGSNNEAGIYQSNPLRDNSVSKINFYHRESAADKTAKYYIYSEADGKYLQADGSWAAAQNWFTLDNSAGTWSLVEKTFQSASAGNYKLHIRNDSAASSSIYLDDIVLWSAKGRYVGVTFDLTAVVQRRLWVSDLIVDYHGTGTTWDTIFGAADLWTDKLSESDTWGALFGSANCGNIKIILQYSEDGITFYDIDHFELYMTEVSLRYFRLVFEIENISSTNYISIEDVNARVYQAA